LQKRQDLSGEKRVIKSGKQKGEETKSSGWLGLRGFGKTGARVYKAGKVKKGLSTKCWTKRRDFNKKER